VLPFHRLPPLGLAAAPSGHLAFLPTLPSVLVLVMPTDTAGPLQGLPQRTSPGSGCGGCRLDLRLFFNKALPDYQQWKDDKSEPDWRDLVTASIAEYFVSVRHPDERPSRAERKQEEHALLREMPREHETCEERVRAWAERTGKSERAFYRRLAELQ
jgi:hypothetical protein